MAEIKVYSTPACPYCEKVKNFLKEHEIEFEEINVAEDRQKAIEMVKKTGQMKVPVTEKGENFVIGFDEEKLKHLIGI